LIFSPSGDWKSQQRLGNLPPQVEFQSPVLRACGKGNFASIGAVSTAVFLPSRKSFYSTTVLLIWLIAIHKISTIPNQTLLKIY